MDSPCESECSLDSGAMLPPSPVSREQLQKRIESLNQQNKYVEQCMQWRNCFVCFAPSTNRDLYRNFRVLKVELETYKIRVKVLQEENRSLRQASVIIVSI